MIVVDSTQQLLTVFVEQMWEHLMCFLRADVSLCDIYIYIRYRFFFKELNHRSIALICPSKL